MSVDLVFELVVVTKVVDLDVIGIACTYTNAVECNSALLKNSSQKETL